MEQESRNAWSFSLSPSKSAGAAGLIQERPGGKSGNLELGFLGFFGIECRLPEDWR